MWKWEFFSVFPVYFLGPSKKKKNFSTYFVDISIFNEVFKYFIL